MWSLGNWEKGVKKEEESLFCGGKWWCRLSGMWVDWVIFDSGGDESWKEKW